VPEKRNGILRLDNLSKHFGGVTAVKDFSLELRQGSIVSIIGPNGAGKTTVFNLTTGVYPVNEGQIHLLEKRIDGLSQHAITRLGIARTFQNIRLFHGLDVLENVMTAYDPRSDYGFWASITHTSGQRRSDRKVRAMCQQYLELVGLQDLQHEQPANLAYGLQRKLEIARALATDPKVLLLDEPAAGLNPSEVVEFIQLVYTLHARFNLSILLIEHRMQVVMEMSHWIYVMNFGELLAQGTPAEIQNHPEVTKAYIGEGEPC
jgi:branched-chain amino acid transport system ATP-binding protein